MGWSNTVYVAAPVFVADPHSISRNLGGQIDWSKVPDTYSGGVDHTVVLGESALAEAEELTVEALTVAIPAGTILDFEGEGKFAKVVADAAVGATKLTVEKLVEALTEGDEAVFHAPGSGPKVIKAGTVLCKLSNGKYIPRVARPGSETAVGLLMSTATEDSRSDATTGYGIIVGGVIFENLLPETITGYKTELGTNGAGFVWVQYADGREAS